MCRRRRRSLLYWYLHLIEGVIFLKIITGWFPISWLRKEIRLEVVARGNEPILRRKFKRDLFFVGGREFLGLLQGGNNNCIGKWLQDVVMLRLSRDFPINIERWDEDGMKVVAPDVKSIMVIDNWIAGECNPRMIYRGGILDCNLRKICDFY